MAFATLSRDEVRSQYRKCVEAGKPELFAAQLHHHLGLVDAHGRPVLDADGFPTLAENRRVKASSLTARVLTEEILGPDWARVLKLHTPDDGTNGAGWVRAVLREEALAPVTPGTFTNVGAWSLAVGGLWQAQFLEGYNVAAFEPLATLFPRRPARAREEKMIGYFGPWEIAREIGPGEAHPYLNMNAMWVQTGPLRTYGGKIEIVRETAFVDITGGTLEREAMNAGRSVRRREMELQIDILTGQTNNFAFGTASDQTATGYNTYGSALFANDIVNPLNDPTFFQLIDDTAAAFRHPLDASLPVDVTFDTWVVPQSLESRARYVAGIESLGQWSSPANAGWPAEGAGQFPTSQMTGPNPWRNRFNVVSGGVWLQERHTRAAASGGLGLTAANARRSYLLDRNNSAVVRMGWDAQTVAVNPNEYVAADQRVIAGQFCNVNMQVQVVNPAGFMRLKVA